MTIDSDVSLSADELLSAGVACPDAEPSEAAAGEAKVWFDPRWWGFHIWLNRHAVTFLLDNIGELKPILKKALKSHPRTSGIVQLFIATRILWVKAIDKGTGILFTSPWLVPGALVPTVWNDGEGRETPPEAPDRDTSLWWTVWEQGKGWSEDMRFPSHHSVAAPALSVTDNNTFLCLHRGDHNDEHLYLTVYKNGEWSTDEKLPEEHCSPAGPGMAWHPKHGLFAIYGRKVASHPLYWTRRSGDGLVGTWDTARETGNSVSLFRPALGVAGDTLVCVYTNTGQPIHDHHPIMWMEMDLNAPHWKWTTPREIHHSAISQHSPSLTVVNNGALVCAWQDHDKVRYTTKKPSEDAWHPPQEIPGATSNRGPAIAHCDNDGANFACVTHTGENNLSLVTAHVRDFTDHSSPSYQWNAPQQLPNHSSSVSPALTFDKYHLEDGGTRAQIVCVHRGYSP
ncbi:hypothetical protein [Amycolatopsis anabasis]|uniref:hypothetical protein n=1 Tax=Amycolatopsis anabasis TaxID=1840409 RepID=UPI00131D0307|nr:hypothetical protein [Amycolatopsis anabasis]